MNNLRNSLKIFSSICSFQVSNFSVSSTCLGRTQWSYTRPRNTGMVMHIPKRLLDGKYWRNQTKSGRGEDGRIKIRHKGGGHSRNFRIVDTVRVPLPGESQEIIPVKDRVLEIGYDPFRSGYIALVAGSGMNQSKLILAPHEVQVGDIITSSRGPPVSLARMAPGDAYPLRYLPLGIMVHNIEKVVGEGGKYCRAAGTYAILQSKSEKEVTLKCQGKSRPMVKVPIDCLATIGRVSNINKKHEIIGKAGRSRWLNRKPKGQTGKDRWHHRKKVR